MKGKIHLNLKMIKFMDKERHTDRYHQKKKGSWERIQSQDQSQGQKKKENTFQNINQRKHQNRRKNAQDRDHAHNQDQDCKSGVGQSR